MIQKKVLAHSFGTYFCPWSVGPVPGSRHHAIWKGREDKIILKISGEPIERGREDVLLWPNIPKLDVFSHTVNLYFFWGIALCGSYHFLTAHICLLVRCIPNIFLHVYPSSKSLASCTTSTDFYLIIVLFWFVFLIAGNNAWAISTTASGYELFLTPCSN